MNDPVDDPLMHYGVLGMKWGVRKDGRPQGFQYGKKGKRSKKPKKPLTTKEKVLIGATIATSIVSAVAISGLSIRNTEFKLKAARGLAWIQNIEDHGLDSYWQQVPPDLYRDKLDLGKQSSVNLIKQHIKNKDLLRYIKDR